MEIEVHDVFPFGIFNAFRLHFLGGHIRRQGQKSEENSSETKKKLFSFDPGWMVITVDCFQKNIPFLETLSAGVMQGLMCFHPGIKVSPSVAGCLPILRICLPFLRMSRLISGE